MGGCIPCGGGRSPAAYERVWRWVRVGEAPVEHTSQVELEKLRKAAGGHGRIERRVRLKQ